jgi:hypothetical protein
LTDELTEEQPVKITKRGVFIEDIGTEGVAWISSDVQGISIRLNIGDGVLWVWSQEEACNLIEALQAAIGGLPGPEGIWPKIQQVPRSAFPVQDRDGTHWTFSEWVRRGDELNQWAPFRRVE